MVPWRVVLELDLYMTIPDVGQEPYSNIVVPIKNVPGFKPFSLPGVSFRFRCPVHTTSWATTAGCVLYGRETADHRDRLGMVCFPWRLPRKPPIAEHAGDPVNMISSLHYGGVEVTSAEEELPENHQ